MGYEKIKINQISKKTDNNFLEFDSKKYNSLKNFVKKYGQIRNLIVYQKNAKYYLATDFYLFDCLKELKKDVAFVYNLGELGEEEIDLISIGLYNNFDFNLVDFAKKIKNILTKYNSDEVSSITHLMQDEVELFPELLEFDFKKYDSNLHYNLYLETNNEYF